MLRVEGMATAPGSIYMKSADLIKKEPLDYGGFGEIYLCYHKTLGQVVLKRVYTGPQRNEGSKQSLREEGSLMTKLTHERVVKLLGVIMEDGDYSLVMELIPKGNLRAMLDQSTGGVHVPISIKGRIILEILEGMVYLTKNKVIHKDLKPENILVDKDFHIKIADLGLATCQTWSRLTKDESRRQSRLGRTVGVRTAGTLCYMAPEHLESIHTCSTEKSDVYSFAIVVWVILAGGEDPYQNARNEDHICACVRNGDRPDESLIPEETPAEFTELMKRCWHQEPSQRPTFQESYDFFLPVYEEKLEPCVERDSLGLRDLYHGPEDLVEKIESMSMFPASLAADPPAPLVSSEVSGGVPVEASIEDLHDHFLPCEPSSSVIQSDARARSIPPSSPGGDPLEHKLDEELWYHKHGSYVRHDQPDSSPNSYYPPHTNYSHRSTPQRLTSEDPTAHSRAGLPPWGRPGPASSSVQSWSKAEPVQPSSEEDARLSSFGLGMGLAAPPAPAPGYRGRQSAGRLPESVSSPSLGQYSQPSHHQHSNQYDRLQSWPAAFPVPESTAPDMCAGLRTAGPLKEPGSVVITNASAVQIGHNNMLSIGGGDPLHRTPRSLSNTSPSSILKESIQKYEDHAVTEEHLDLLRENIGGNWKQIARRLGLTDVEVDTINHDHARDGLPEMVYQMVERWRMKEGSVGCTVGRLCRDLENHVKVDLLQKLLDISKARTTP